MGGYRGTIVGSRPFTYVGAKVGARLERADNTYVQLCGHFVVELRGRRVEQRFPSRQGRMLFAYLVLQRPRAVGRHELIESIWAGDLPANCASALTVLLSKLRAAVGADVLAGRGSVYVALPPDARVDVEQALAALHRAESAVVQGEWARARCCPATTTFRGWTCGGSDSTMRSTARWRRMPPPAWDSAAPRSRAPSARRDACSSVTRSVRPVTGCSCRPSPRAATWPKR